MRFPTFESLTDISGALHYDFNNNQKYCMHDNLIVWESGVVDLTSSFENDTSRRSWGHGYGLEVCSVAELPMDRYHFVLDDIRLRKADLGGCNFLLDYHANVAVALGHPLGLGGKSIQNDTQTWRTARWVHPNALPDAYTPAVAWVYDRDVAAVMKPYCATLLASVSATRQMLGAGIRHKWCSDYSALERRIAARAPAGEVLAECERLGFGNALAHAKHLLTRKVAQLCRRRIEGTYIKLIKKGGHHGR